MPTSVGPNTFGEENLVFAFDTGDTVNSYKGEPTENLLSGSTKQNISTWSYSTPGGVDCTALGETYRGGQVYRLQDADGVDPDVSVDNYVMYNSVGNVETGSQYAFSFDLRVIQKSNTSNAGGSGNGAWIWYGTNTTNIAFADYEIGEWNRVSMTVTAGVSWDLNVDYIIPRIDYDNSIIDVANFQVEKKSHATPFVNGTRSATEGLKDLTGNSTLDLTNVSFDSDAQMTFDGTDDFLTLPDIDTYSSTAKFTVEGVVRAIGGNWGRIFTNGSNGVSGSVTGFINTDLIISTSSSRPYIQLRVGNSGFILGTQISENSWSGDDFVMYFAFSANKESRTGTYLFRFGQNNGLLQEELSGTYTPGTSTGFVENRLGAETDNEAYAEMDMHMFKLYNRELSLEEMRKNYNVIKGRFNI